MPDHVLQRTPIEADDWIRGKRDAPVTLLEYGDFECSHCAAVRPVLEGLVDEAPDGIRLAFRHFPITTTHPHAAMAAEAAEAAGAQGKFWEMHDMLFGQQPELEFEDLRWCAEQVGCDVLRFDDEMAAHAYTQEVRRDFRRGISDGVNGTPTVFINGVRYDGPRDRVSMMAAIAQIAPGRRRPPGLRTR
jgi:protein-disulfide isomerase